MPTIHKDIVEKIPLDEALKELGDPDLKSTEELSIFILRMLFATTVKLNEVVDHVNASVGHRSDNS